MMNLYHKFTMVQSGTVDYSFNTSGTWTARSTDFFATPGASAGHGVTASPDGKTILVASDSNQAFREYNTPVAFDASQATYSGFERGDNNLYYADLSYFGPGRVLNIQYTNVRRGSLTSDYGISGYASVQTFAHGFGGTNSYGISAAPDGKHFIIFNQSGNFTSYELPTAYSLTGRITTGNKTLAGTHNYEVGLNVSPDGRWMYYTGHTGGTFSLRYYEMTTPWDVDTAVLRKTWSVNNPGGGIRGLYIDFIAKQGYVQTTGPSRVYSMYYTPP